jgi:hypothetical protein
MLGHMIRFLAVEYLPHTSYSYYTELSPDTSIGWGVSASITWGRQEGESANDVAAQRQRHGLGAAGNSQLGQDIADMRFDRGWTDS